MAEVEENRVTVSRRIGAPPSEIFQILANPGRHTEIDGSGMLRGAIAGTAVSGVGDVFAMKMYYKQFGDYEMNNRVVEYELDRRIVWEPERRDIDEASWHYRWGYELTPDGEDRTVVTEIFDCTRSPEEGKQAVKGGRTWIESMTATLERLDQLCTAQTASEPTGQAAGQR
jgi:uncharacterized protein YndB with AHSA1/START domain